MKDEGVTVEHTRGEQGIGNNIKYIREFVLILMIIFLQ